MAPDVLTETRCQQHKNNNTTQQHKTNFKENQKLFQYFIEAYTLGNLHFNTFFCVLKLHKW